MLFHNNFKLSLKSSHHDFAFVPGSLFQDSCSRILVPGFLFQDPPSSLGYSFQDSCSRILVPGSSFHDSCFRILVQDSCSGSSFHDICSRILVQDARSWILVVPYLILYSNTEFHILYFTLILSSKNSSLIYMFSIAGHAHTAEPNWLNFLYLSF